jgi:hypothetical protein
MPITWNTYFLTEIANTPKVGLMSNFWGAVHRSGGVSLLDCPAVRRDPWIVAKPFATAFTYWNKRY